MKGPRVAPTNPTDAVIAKAWERRTDEVGHCLVNHPSIEEQLAEATGLSRRRVTKGMDAMYIVRGYKF